MRIISDFHDYYDCIQRHGQSDVVYLRDQSEIKERWFDGPRSAFLRWMCDSRWTIIGFCGKLYPLLAVSLPQTDKFTRCYWIEEVDGWVESNFRQNAVDTYFAPKWRKWRFAPLHRDDVIKWFGKWNGAKHETLFRQYRVPIFAANRDKLVLNPRLQDFEFYRVFDPATAFQEIEMYLGGVLVAAEKPIPEIPDNVMRDAKGFDDRSFKKEPTKHAKGDKP